MNITGATRVLAVIGDPVGHSLSPLMHNGWIEDHGLDAVYVALPLRSDQPAAAIRALGSFGLAGANVTIPHKEAAARAADRSEAPAANVLRWERDGSLSAFNTDGAGFLDALDEAAPNWRGRVRSALVLGAGGAAVAIGQALAQHVEQIRFANRTADRAAAAASGLRHGGVTSWDELPAAFAAADLVVQATALGMEGQPSRDWPLSHCRAGAIAVDIVYRPLETGFLRAARSSGLVAVDGLGMLIHQGARAFDLWFGIKPDASRARARLTAAVA
jgi:shikimate dehydrogenase